MHRPIPSLAGCVSRSARGWLFFSALLLPSLTLLLLSTTLLLLSTTAALAQAPQAQFETQQQPALTLSGTVTDPSGAVVAGATILLVPAGADSNTPPVATALSGPAGAYQLRAAPGAYTVVAQATGFARFESPRIRLRTYPGANPTSSSTQNPSTLRTLDIHLQLPQEIERVDVPGDADESGGNANRAGTSIVLRGQDIETMPLDSAAMLDELQGLAGSTDAELYVDGFSGMKLPPRGSIREIRINQNPYSALNDISPVNGVIQVSTKPGTNKTHGEFYLYGDDSAWNAQNPFDPGQPPYYAIAFGGSLSGPLGKRTSYILSLDQIDNQTNSAIDAQALEAYQNQPSSGEAIPSPNTMLVLSPRLDLQASPRSTLTLRYTLYRNNQTNGGLGQLALPSQAFNNSTLSDTFQAGDSYILGTKALNDAHIQYIRQRANQTPANFGPAIVVEGAFIAGGNDLGAFSDHQDKVELQDYLSLAEGRHYFNFGGRLRIARDANRSTANFNGEFIFSTLAEYNATPKVPSEYTLNAGNQNAEVTIADAGLFFQDDWKLKPSLTFSYGLRFETQTYIPDHADWAPRIGFSWGLDTARNTAPPKYVLRGGAGFFYRRFTTDSALQIERQNGINQQEYVATTQVSTTTTCPGPQCAPTSYALSPGFHAPYYMGASIAIDRRLGKYGTASLTYLYSRGVHSQLIENINAPEPGTFNPGVPGSGMRPLGGIQNIFEYISQGVYRSNRLTANETLRVGARLNLFSYYMLRFDKSDTDPNSGFPSNNYDLGADYSRSLGDIRHTANVGANLNWQNGLHASGYLRAMTGAPFDIVVGEDLNGDTQFNDRPAFATNLARPSVVATKWGTFDTSPIPGQTIIPRNYGQGPGFFLLNLGVGKSFNLGPETSPATGFAQANAGPPSRKYTRKYTLDFWIESLNALNHPNFTPPVGTLNSPLFGQSLGVTGPSSLGPDRVIDLQATMRF